MEGAGQPDSQDGIDALRLRVPNEQEAFDAFSKRITSWFLLFAFSDGTSPDFGPSSRGFIESLTGVHLEEPQDQELVMWKSIYSCIHRQNFPATSKRGTLLMRCSSTSLTFQQGVLLPLPHCLLQGRRRHQKKIGIKKNIFRHQKKHF